MPVIQESKVGHRLEERILSSHGPPRPGATARSICVRVLCLLVVGSCCSIGPLRAEEDADAWLVKGLVSETLEMERTGAEVPWSNANTGNSGVIRVERTYYQADGTPCRDYVRTTKRWDGGQSTTKGSGCRMTNGRWFLDETQPGEAGPSPKSTGTAAAKGSAPSGAGKSEADVKTVAARSADEDLGAKSGEPPVERPEKRTPPPPPAKPQAPAFTLPSKSEL